MTSRNLPQSLLPFIQKNLLGYELLAVLQVGSSARGHALPKSDIDFMAFYSGVPADFRAFPKHTVTGDVEMTIEHHDFVQFLCDNGDFGFNLASLRQMHKVRDGIVVLGDGQSLSLLKAIASRASLDPRLVLRFSAGIIEEISSVREQSEVYQQQKLIDWTEFLSTMLLVMEPGRSAYSKPKWLLRSLKAASLSPAVELIHELYGDGDISSRLKIGSNVLDELHQSTRKVSVSQDFERLLKTVSADAAQMIINYPDEAFPAIRFATIQLWRALHGKLPTDDLGTQKELPADIVAALGGPPHDISRLWLRFAAFFQGTFKQARQASFRRFETSIGTTRLMSHLLRSYDAAELFPYVSHDLVRDWVTCCEKGDLL